METKKEIFKEVAQLGVMAVAMITVLFVLARLMMCALWCAEWLFLKIG